MTASPDDLQSFRHILVIEDAKAKRIVTLEESTYSIGRDLNNTVIIYDPQVSREHATLIKVSDYKNNRYLYKIIDGNLAGKKSTNGLTINGRFCLSHELKHGDLIEFGSKAKASYHVIDQASDADLLTTVTQINKTTVPELNNRKDFKKTLTSNGDFQNLDREDLIRLASFPELSPNPIVEIDWQGNITYLNPIASEKFTDIYQAKLDHPILSGLLNKSRNQQGNLIVREVKIGKETFEQYIHYLTESKLIRSYLFDCTKRNRAEAALKKSEERYRNLVRQASDGIFLVDQASKRFVEVNSAYCKLIGYTAPEILSLTLYDVVDLEAEQIDQQLQQINEQSDFVIETQHRDKNDCSIDVEVSASSVRFDENAFWCFVVRDITKRKELEKRLQHRAFHDNLTDLPNRTLFNEHLSTAIAHGKRHQHQMAVMFLDLDHFKQINDTYGHEIGDRLLQDFAERLQTCLREEDVVARWGGDEFVVLMPEIDNPQSAAKVSQRIIETLEKPFEIEQNQLQINTSIGIAIYPSDGKEGEALLKHADDALYRVKNQGRNNYQYYSSALNSRSSALIKGQSSLYQALSEEQFSLYYQPQINIDTNRTTGVEALLRWHHPRLGEIPPNKFIPLAQETDVIMAIDTWVLQTVCAQNKAWQEAGLPPVKVAINISLQQFQSPDLPTLVAQTLAETGLEARWLELELTEAMILSDLNFAKKRLQNLHEIGVSLALGDFGSGNFSLGHLRQLPVNTLKMDCPFVQTLQDTTEDIAIVSAIISLGRGFNLQVVAQGVETEKQFQLLRRLQCKEMQGYWFAHPLRVEEVSELLFKTNLSNVSCS